jgi:hypothetical protein
MCLPKACLKKPKLNLIFNFNNRATYILAFICMGSFTVVVIFQYILIVLCIFIVSEPSCIGLCCCVG